MTTCVEYRARPYRAFECATSGSVIAWYWSVMRRRTVAQIEHDLVDIAPAPALGRVVTLDDRVPCLPEVPRRVPVRRLVAAPDMTTGPTQAQMHPRRADLEALLAPERARRYVANGRLMRASVDHQVLRSGLARPRRRSSPETHDTPRRPAPLPPPRRRPSCPSRSVRRQSRRRRADWFRVSLAN